MMAARLERTHPFGPRLSIERYRFDNGLTLLYCEDRSAPVFSYQTWFAVGSRHERDGKSGLAHLLEHLMFNETVNLPHGEFDRRVERVGAESNAATYLDWTFYMVNAPAEAIDLVVELESERMQHLVLKDEVVAAEREVVKNERLQCVEDDVDGAVGEALFRAAFDAHGYGRPTIGWMEDIEQLTSDDCRRFYSTYYAPNNATIVVVGDVERERLLTLVGERYGSIPASELPVEDQVPEPPQTAGKLLEMTQPTPTPKVAIAFKCPAMGDVDHAPLVLLGDILWSGRSSRAYRRLVHELELASEFGGQVGHFRDPSIIEVSITLREGVEVERVLEELEAILTELRRAPPSDAELARAKARTELSTFQGMQSSSGKAEQIGFCEVVLGDPAGLWSRLDACDRVTRSDLLRVARKYFVESVRTLLVVTPGGEDDGEDDEDDEDAEDAA
ncbi:MAG: insulinase family protein [Deltaproteobacteria bacterium]|nr:insulinase family protein [Deltaproteobacteria bacterium]